MASVATTGCWSDQTGGSGTPWVVPNKERAAATTADMGFQFAKARSQSGMFAVVTNTLDTKPSRNTGLPLSERAVVVVTVTSTVLAAAQNAAAEARARSRFQVTDEEVATYMETARVRPPDDDEAQFLHMDPDQRVVTIQRTARTASGRIVEVNEITLPAHQWELVYEWPANQ
jgi:hypothetical protein